MNDKVRYTLVFEWEAGKEPTISAGTTFEGGQCVKVQFNDALEELEQAEATIEELRRRA